MNSTIADSIWYYVLTIAASCVSAGFLMTIEFQGKLPLFFVFIISFLMGSFASFVFALILRRTAHLFGRNKWWVWLLAGAILAPVLILFAAMWWSTGPVTTSGRHPSYFEFSLLCPDGVSEAMVAELASRNNYVFGCVRGRQRCGG